MLIYKLLACFAMIVAMSSAEDFLAPMSSRNMTDALEVPEPLGPSIPDDSVFVPHNVSRNHLMLAFKEGKFVSGSDLDACKSLALSEGADVYTLMHGTCALVTLDFPLCSSQEGDSLIYVRKDLLSDGSPEDGATLDQINQIQGGPVIQSSVKAFRVQGPTVLQIDTSRISYKPVEQSQMYVTDNGGLKFVKGSILVDPSCYTSSTCGTPVVDFGNQINNHPYVTLKYNPDRGPLKFNQWIRVRLPSYPENLIKILFELYLGKTGEEALSSSNPSWILKYSDNF